MDKTFVIALFTIIRTDHNMLLLYHSHKHISYPIRTIARSAINVMFASGLDCVNYQMNQVIGNRYVRIQSQLKLASADMDNITSKNIKSLQQEAKAMIEDNQKLIDKLCDFIS